MWDSSARNRATRADAGCPDADPSERAAGRPRDLERIAEPEAIAEEGTPMTVYFSST